MRAERLVVSGGATLRGAVQVSGAKNAALPAMAASLLSAEPCVLENVPDIVDVGLMARILETLGTRVERLGPTTLRLQTEEVTSTAAPNDLVVNQRASFLVTGALLGRCGRAACAPPGGDVIGQRPIDLHLSGFRSLGAEVERRGARISVQAPGGLRGSRILLDYPSVLGTQNLMLAAVLAEGTTTIINAASEPEIVCLAEMLRRMGAKIEGAGTQVIRIQGVERLSGTTQTIIPDRIEAGTFAIAAAITGGDVEICGAEPRHMEALICKLQEVGAQVEEREGAVRVRRTGPMRAVSVQAVPYPGLATDLQAPMAALLTQATGVSFVHERVFDNRLLYVGELRKLGAEVVSAGTTAVISGPTPLVGATVRALDIRSGAALVLAALVAQGTTEIYEVDHLARGYEEMDVKLRALGASVYREQAS
ncbi:MAG TPA: UDP-N-acetylglucosamine 1-carboxyvinyltransferase [Dehalococcoidia bacterium]